MAIKSDLVGKKLIQKERFSNHMKIQRIKLDNFRGIRKADIELVGKSAVIFGINGTGKTTILRAIDLIYANIIGVILQTRKRLALLDVDDINNGTNSSKISIDFLMEANEIIEYGRYIDREDKQAHDKKNLDKLVALFRKLYMDELEEQDDETLKYVKKDRPMPIFVNYGVNRAVMDIAVSKVGKMYSKLDAFENAIESRIDFKSFFEWFRQQEDLENEMIARTKGMIKGYKLPALDAVRQAMLSMFPEFSSVRFDRQMDTLVFEKNGMILKINQLSDGEKCVIALFGDIARRMAIANDDILMNPLDLQGVVLIDEVDLHLHPSWQRKIAKMLQDTFHNVQFILTTHSPQVLGGIDDRFNIFSIEKTEKDILVNRAESLYGWDTNIILEEAMGTYKTVDEVVEHTEKMYKAYEDNNLEEAGKEADLIDTMTNGHNDSVSGMRVLISRKRRMQTK